MEWKEKFYCFLLSFKADVQGPELLASETYLSLVDYKFKCGELQLMRGMVLCLYPVIP